MPWFRPFALILLLAAPAAWLTAETVDPPAREGADTAPHLVLVSIDGLRWDLPARCPTPALDRLAARGLKAEALQPVYPTLTFPNHYAIATGRLPAEHGLAGNRFPDETRTRWYDMKDRAAVQDGRWYLAEPIWVTAERSGLPTAAFYFVGTEADVGGVRPTRWLPFDAEVSAADRVDQVLAWLAEPPDSRPRLVTLYFEDVDEHAHWYGPESHESLQALQRVDTQLGRLMDGLDALPHGRSVSLLVVSDHGLGAYDPGREALVLDRVVDMAGVRVVEGGPFANLYFEDAAAARAPALRDAINASWDCGRALLPRDAPAAWGLTAGGRFPDLLVQADPGCAVLSTEAMRGKLTPGDHGWAPEAPDMRGVFYAMGPRIPAGARPGVLRVTDIHPLMLAILGLETDAAGPAATGPAARLLSPPLE